MRLVRLREVPEVVVVEALLRLRLLLLRVRSRGVDTPLLRGRGAINEAREPVEVPGVHHDLAGLERLDRLPDTHLREVVLLPGRVGYLGHQPLAVLGS